MQPEPTIEPRALRNALGAFATGVTIVTTRAADGLDVGLTANSFSSVSLNPPMVLWSLAKTSGSIEAFRKTRYFAVHVLAADQENLSARFAARGIEKFSGLALERGSEQIPLLDGCTARFECRTAFQYQGGDHVIFVGEVENLTHSERPPLVFHGGRYGMVIRKEAVPASPARDPGSAPLARRPDLPPVAGVLPYTPRRAGGKAAPRLDRFRVRGPRRARPRGRQDRRRDQRDEHLSRPQRDAGRDASLAARGLVSAPEPVRGDSVVHMTAAGRQAMIEMIAILKSAEADALEGFDFSEMQLLKQLLSRIVDKT